MLSIVIPLFDEEDSIPILAQQIDTAMAAYDSPWECIWVDDGSKDMSWSKILELPSPHRGVSLQYNCGQATAIMAGIDAASFDLILTMDSDLQNDPNDISRLLAVLTDNVDVVCGARSSRKDSFFSKKLPSAIANFLARKLTGVPVSDLGCTLRVFRRELVNRERIVGEMHRLLVVHFFLLGANIVEIPVNHRKRLYGVSKYGLERFFKFIADLLLAKSLGIITKKPLYFFGGVSLISLFSGLLLILSAIILRITDVKHYIDTSLVSSGVVLLSTSLVIMSIGLIAEILIRQLFYSGARVQYLVRNTH